MESESDSPAALIGAGLTSRWAVPVCAVATIVVLMVLPTGAYSYAGDQRTLYDWTTWVLAIALGAAGSVIAFAPAHRSVAAIIGVTSATQLAGTGIVAYRRWYTSGGFTNTPGNLSLLRALAIILFLSGMTATASCGAYLSYRRRAKLGDAPRPSIATAIVAIAIALAVLVPFAMGYESSNRTTQVGAHALMYSLPWAFVLVLSAWLDRPSGLTAVVAVAASAALPSTGQLMIPAPRPALGSLIAALACLAVFIIRRFDQRRAQPALAHPAP